MGVKNLLKKNLLFAGKNLIRMFLLLFAVSIATFALVAVSPIDPLQANVGQAALGSMSEEQKEKLRSYWGADTPPVERYVNWAKAALGGDFGTSLLYRQPGDESNRCEISQLLVFNGVGLGYFRAFGICAGCDRRCLQRQVAG